MESSPNIAYPTTAAAPPSDSLRARVVAALLGLPILLALIGMDATPEWHGTTLLLLVLFVAGIGAEELSALLAHRGLTSVPQLALMVATIPPLLAFVYGRAEIPVLLLASSIIIALNILFIALGVVPDILHRGWPGLRDAVLIIFGSAVIGGGYSFILLLRKPLGNLFAGGAPLPTDLHIAFPAMGWWAVAALFLLVWTTDTLAYFVGRTVGGPKLAPAISPKKTWSGTLAGVAGATVLAVALNQLPHAPRFALPLAAAIGASVGAAAVLGDLLQSAVKRACAVKDSGSFVPGHGGILDRFDSMLFAAPTLFFFLWWALR